MTVVYIWTRVIAILIILPRLLHLKGLRGQGHTLHRYLNENGLSSFTDRGQSPDELLLPNLQSLKMDGDFLLESLRLVDLV